MLEANRSAQTATDRRAQHGAFGVDLHLNLNRWNHLETRSIFLHHDDKGPQQSWVTQLTEAWDHLAAAFGRNWPEFFFMIDEPLNKLFECRSDVQRKPLLDELGAIINSFPDARDKIHEACCKAALEKQKGMACSRAPVEGLPLDMSGIGASPPDPAIDLLAKKLHPNRIDRSAEISAPLRLGRGDIGKIGVRLRPNGGPSAAIPLQIQPSLDLEVRLRANADDFRILGARFKVLDPAEVSPDAIRFHIRALTEGSKKLVLDFAQAGAIVGSIGVTIQVSCDRMRGDQHSYSSLRLGGRYVPPPDLDLRVNAFPLPGGRTKLHYELHSPNDPEGFHHCPIDGPTLETSAEDFLKYLIKKLERLSDGVEVSGAPLTARRIANRIEGLGRLLYEELFPDALRAAIRRIRDRVATVQITSDECWIPWELIRIADEKRPDEFLCECFQVTRWVAGPLGPAWHFGPLRLACVESSRPPGLAPLPHAAAERQKVTEGLARLGIEDVSPPLATIDAVEDLMASGTVDLWHFAAHGASDLEQPEESSIRLADGQYLRAEDVQPTRRREGQNRPFVFMNACGMGQMGRTLSRFGGWPSAWMGRARCGAFLGPLWAVQDQLAFEFARVFYVSLCAGDPMGKAVQQARENVRRRFPNDPGWLSYAVFAHPNARLVSGRPGGPV